MNRHEACQAIRQLSKKEFEEKIKHQRLPKGRQDLLFKFIQGEINVSNSSRLDIEEYAIKYLIPEVYNSLSHEGHPYSSCELYEYDPSKNGQNIIKHGIGFCDVVSYSEKFGTLSIPIPDEIDGTRCIIFSDLKLIQKGDELDMPPPGIREMNYTISVVHKREGNFRFISARLLSSKKKKYEKSIDQALGEIITDAQARKDFVGRSVEILERYLICP